MIVRVAEHRAVKISALALSLSFALTRAGRLTAAAMRISWWNSTALWPCSGSLV